MEIFQIRLKVYLLKSIELIDCQSEVTSLIDQVFGENEETIAFHRGRQFKNYTFDLLHPIEKDKIYKKDKIYTLTIRTANSELANLFSNKLAMMHTEKIKSLTTEVKLIHQKQIEKIYSITPIVIKTDNGYWKKSMSFDQYIDSIRVNLIKKYNEYYKTKMNEDFDLFTGINKINRMPIKCKYKNISFLGDKFEMQVAPNKNAQELAMLAIGTGVGTSNSRGYGFVNYRYI